MFRQRDRNPLFMNLIRFRIVHVGEISCTNGSEPVCTHYAQFEFELYCSIEETFSKAIQIEILDQLDVRLQKLPARFNFSLLFLRASAQCRQL